MKKKLIKSENKSLHATVLKLEQDRAKLRQQLESESWKSRLFHSLSDPDIILKRFHFEAADLIDVTTSNDAAPQFMSTGNSILTLELYKPPKNKKDVSVTG
jgi:hypothetical protein